MEIEDEFELDNSPTEKKLSKAMLFTNMFKDSRIFISDENICFIEITLNNDKKQFVDIESTKFNHYAHWLFNMTHHDCLKQMDFLTGTKTLISSAYQSNERRKTYNKSAFYKDDLYIDLGREDYKCVKITKEGWSIVEETPIIFRRNQNCYPLPIPERDGRIEELKPLINYGNDRNFIMIVSWLVGALHPDIPYPLLNIEGQNGSAKSSMCNVLKKLIDPDSNFEVGGGKAKTEENMLLTAHNNYIVFFDNLKTLNSDFSDILCRISTGTKHSKRKLYDNSNEIVYWIKKPIILNGLIGVVMASDLADRTINIELPKVADENRMEVNDIKNRLEALHPKLLGSIFDLIVSCLRNTRKIKNLPRMSDFIQWISGIEDYFNLEEGEVNEIYKTLHLQASADIVNDTILFDSIMNILRQNDGKWKNTPTKLFEELKRNTAKTNWNELPKNPKKVGYELKKLNLSFKDAGIHIESKKSNGVRYIIMNLIEKNVSNIENTNVISINSGIRVEME